jgi:L-seryl-tRNA(Ser) seleniumtransferase
VAGPREGDFSGLPKVDAVLGDPILAPSQGRHPRPWIVTAVRNAISEMRAELKAGGEPATTAAAAAARAVAWLDATPRWSLRPVVNATGVVIHTNIGRSPLSRQALRRIAEVAGGYCTLEYDVARGARGERFAHVEHLLTTLTGAEAAVVVNNNAAAVLISLAALASGREVVVSRGELVEIGGSFRMPDVMTASGAILREVGTTNRTTLKDYRKAVGPATGLLLKVHTSNYRVVGFTAEVGRKELAALGKELAVPVMDDLGSGCLVPLPGGEITVREVVASGVDLVTFSGDKLLGGPQAGIVVGRRDLVEKVRSHPLHRAVRIDKLTLAALEGTLWDYLEGPGVEERVPTLAMLTAPRGPLLRRTRRLATLLAAAAGARAEVLVREDSSQVGGGSLPLLSIPTPVVAIKVPGMSLEGLEAAFRGAPVPVLGRISEGWYLLNLRTVAREGEREIAAAFAALLATPEARP